MSILLLKQKTIVKGKWLIGIFLISFLAILIIRLPVSLFSRSLNNIDIQYSDSVGTIWDANLSNLSVAGIIWQDATIALEKTPLLLGNIQISFKLKSNGRILSGTSMGLEKDIQTFRSVNAFTTATPVINEKLYPSNIRIFSEELMLDRKGSCQSGAFNISTDLISNLFSGLLENFGTLEGIGECNQGNISYSLQTTQDDIEIHVNGEIIEDINKGVVMVKLPLSMEQNKVIAGEFSANGFVKINDSWQATIEGYL